MLYIVYAYFLFKIKNFYKKKEPIPSSMSHLKESDSFYLFSLLYIKKTAIKSCFFTRLAYLRYA